MKPQYDPNYYNDNQDYIKDLCLKCGLKWANYCGLCDRCKEEAKRK